ncbi:5-oxoprolinase subunit PxpB [Priestia taiwanensis]|uniref:Allophanate hydrolase n=1 Tax=Priestia taiwanensis TaxID=1347902 RepID=A0A917AY33_9BACI|nr:5-oxoprolinase subunit PxpB [Priestia taiwanensis]MBM7364784.1 inhibitor of KinA [Priestia taiwanensis]GGE79571.1 allophanate hydrolase [Priestia taiwanensis]
MKCYPLGDTGIQLVFGTVISEETNQRIRVFVDYLSKHPINGIVEWVPAYTTLAIYYRPDVVSYSEIQEQLEVMDRNIEGSVESSASLIFEIPTYYSGEDLAFVAEYNGLSEEEVITIHSGQDYLIYMMGFVPGFPYLGGMSKQIATPRRENPRANIPVGSVGIAGDQTGIYPLETPGGWQLIGQTPVKLYDPTRKNPILLSAGHYVRFVPISESEYAKIESAINVGEYTVTHVGK